jgi:hypothetical protein
LAHSGLVGGGAGARVSTVLRSQRVAPVAAVAFGVLTLGLDLASVPLDSITGTLGPGGQLADWVTTAVGVVPAVAVGTLLAARRPGNPIGWILLTIFLLAAAPIDDYAVLDYRMHHGTLPLGWVAVVLGSAWPILLLLISILLWVFPDGQLPSGRWRRVSVVLVASGVVLGLAASAKGVVAVARHDVRINASGNLASRSTNTLAALSTVLILGLLASGLTWLVVQVPRYRRSSGERREQLKWLYCGAIVFVLSFFIPGQAANNLIGPFGAAALPVCIGVAVLNRADQPALSNVKTVPETIKGCHRWRPGAAGPRLHRRGPPARGHPAAVAAAPLLRRRPPTRPRSSRGCAACRRSGPPLYGWLPPPRVPSRRP